MEALLIGLATAFNVLVIKWKLENDRVSDGILDACILAALAWAFGDTLGGMIIATVSSAIVSVYLIAKPFKLDDDEEPDEST